MEDRVLRFRKVKVPAHREFFVTLIRPNGAREPWYLPYVYNTSGEAQLEADRKNAHYKHGQLVVEYVDRPASVSMRSDLFQL